MEDCLFCKIECGDIPSEKVYDGDGVFAIKDLNPQAPVHILVLPKKHFSTILEIEADDRELIGSIFTAANQIARGMALATMAQSLDQISAAWILFFRSHKVVIKKQ